MEKKIYMCVYITESIFYTPETNNIVNQLCFNKKHFLNGGVNMKRYRNNPISLKC